MKHRGVVASVVNRFAWDREQFHDIVQSVFEKATRSIRGFEGRCRLATWFYRIAVNECMEFNRRYSRERDRFRATGDGVDIFEDVNAPDGLTAASDSELREGIADVVRGLPPAARAAFSLFYFAGYRGPEAAEALGITQAAFFMRLKAARDRVREALERRGWKP